MVQLYYWVPSNSSPVFVHKHEVTSLSVLGSLVVLVDSCDSLVKDRFEEILYYSSIWLGVLVVTNATQYLQVAITFVGFG